MTLINHVFSRNGAQAQQVQALRFSSHTQPGGIISFAHIFAAEPATAETPQRSHIQIAIRFEHVVQQLNTNCLIIVHFHQVIHYQHTD